ncbi:hypothetical protein SAMN04488107_0130 [Geodermatophilus saharensis]|uniref:Uncharacterized protein n=1 Tax=Geodermatophilus saharensis TaxID=1137994 RepID=A0A238ZJI2_9ACTN|nr:hypothetical protein [Geodermatophilus saharensis]SNR83332.1 hypothetical protein SAMN04488107_0130 [Geodermatophilus saharensis]
MTTALDSGPATRGQHVAAAVVVAAAAAAVVLAPRVAGDDGRLGAVLLLQVALAAGWARAMAPPGAPGAVVLAVAAAVAADLLVVGVEDPGPGVLLVVAGPALVVAVVHQMLRRPPRTDVVGSLGAVALLVASACALALLLLPGVPGEADSWAGSPLVVVAAGLAAGLLVDAVLPRPAIAEEASRGVPGLLAAVGAAVAVALLAGDAGTLVDALSGITTGVVLGLVAALAGTAASFLLADAGRRVPAVAGAAVEGLLPLAVCAPALLALAVV